MATPDLHPCYETNAGHYANSHARWLRFAGGEAQCAFEGAVTALLKPGHRMLDAACGTGSVARRLLAATDGRVDLVLLDASPNMLASCRDVPARRIAGCMTEVPFADGHFDLVTCAWGIEVLEDPKRAVQEFIRVTRPGGHICLVFCADRPAHSLFGRALRNHVHLTRRGQFLDHVTLKAEAVETGARHVQILHCTGPAAAMIIHV